MNSRSFFSLTRDPHFVLLFYSLLFASRALKFPITVIHVSLEQNFSNGAKESSGNMMSMGSGPGKDVFLKIPGDSNASCPWKTLF